MFVVDHREVVGPLVEGEGGQGGAGSAEAMGLELGEVASFTRSGGDPLGYSPQLVDAVFSFELLEDGENSPIIELDDEPIDDTEEVLA